MADDTISHVSSSGSEYSLCETAAEYISDSIHLITCRENTSDCISDKMDVTTPRQMEEFRDEVEKDRERGEDIHFVFDKAEFLSKGGQTLRAIVEQMAPIPVESAIAAKIVKDVASALLSLHTRHLAHGFLSIDTILVDSRFNAHLLVEHFPRDGRHTHDGRFPKAEDIFHLGEVMHILLSCETAKFGEENDLILPYSTANTLDVDGLRLTRTLLSQFPKFRPTAGAVVYHEWTKNSMRLTSECRVRLIW